MEQFEEDSDEIYEWEDFQVDEPPEVKEKVPKEERKEEKEEKKRVTLERKRNPGDRVLRNVLYKIDELPSDSKRLFFFCYFARFFWIWGKEKLESLFQKILSPLESAWQVIHSFQLFFVFVGFIR